MKIYHNNRCSKSRQCLAVLEKSNHDFEIVYYLDTPPSINELKNLLKMLEIKPIELVRKNEAIWKEQFKGKELSDEAIISAMATYPKLIERPIIVKGTKAVIGRPIENMQQLL